MAASPASKPVILPVAGSLSEKIAPWSVPPRMSLPRCLILSAHEPAGIAAASATGDPAMISEYLDVDRADPAQRSDGTDPEHGEHRAEQQRPDEAQHRQLERDQQPTEQEPEVVGDDAQRSPSLRSVGRFAKRAVSSVRSLRSLTGESPQEPGTEPIAGGAGGSPATTLPTVAFHSFAQLPSA